MILPSTKLRLKDNSGAIWVKCIKNLKSSRKKGSKALDLILVSVRKIKTNKNKVEKGKMYKCVIIRSKKNLIRSNGNSVSFGNNCGILLNEKNLPIASRIKGPVFKEFRIKHMTKVLILSNAVM